MAASTVIGFLKFGLLGVGFVEDIVAGGVWELPITQTFLETALGRMALPIAMIALPHAAPGQVAIASIMFAFTGYGFVFALTAIVPPALMALLAQRWLERGVTFGPV